jgi:ribosomal protein L30/L7E
MSTRVKRGKHQGYSPRNVKHHDGVTYLRFVVGQIDDDSQMELGVFHAVGNLQDSGQLDPHEEEEGQAARDWFNWNMERPTRFTASKPPFHRKKSKAISWFQGSAHEHIARVRSLVAILRHHGVAVRMLRADRVGYVVYEDEYQIVAEPFAEHK